LGGGDEGERAKEMAGDKKSGSHGKKSKKTTRRAALAQAQASAENKSAAGKQKSTPKYGENLTPEDLERLSRVQKFVRRRASRRGLLIARKVRAEREKVLWEMLYGERRYLKQLNVLQSTFMVPLHRSLHSPAPLISEDAYEALFGDIQAMLFYNTTFLEGFQASLDAARSAKCNHSLGFAFVASACSMIADFAQVYVRFINSFGNSCGILSAMGDNSTFAGFLKKRYEAPLCTTLDAMLMLPVARFGDYIMFFKELVRLTLPGHPDFTELVGSFEMLRSVVPLLRLDQTAIVFRTKGQVLPKSMIPTQRPGAERPQIPELMTEQPSPVLPGGGMPPKAPGGHRRRKSRNENDHSPHYGHRRTHAAPPEKNPRLFELLEVLLDGMAVKPSAKQHIVASVTDALPGSTPRGGKNEGGETSQKSKKGTGRLLLTKPSQAVLSTVEALEAECAKMRAQLEYEQKVVLAQACGRRFLALLRMRRLRKLYGEDLSQSLLPRAKEFIHLVREEEAYITYLKELHRDLIAPVRRAVSAKEMSYELYDLADVFDVLDMMIALHDSFRTELHGIENQFPNISTVGALMMKLSSQKQYVQFAIHNRSTIDTLARALGNSEFCRITKLSAEKDRERLEGLLQRPLNQLQHYQQIIGEMLKHTPEAHPDRANLEVTSAAFGRLNQETVEAFGDGFRVSQLRAVRYKVDGLPTGFDIAASRGKIPRVFMRDGSVSVSEGKGKLRTRYAFLFSDTLMLCSEQTESTYVFFRPSLLVG
jgi:RhoGEF domain